MNPDFSWSSGQYIFNEGLSLVVDGFKIFPECYRVILSIERKNKTFWHEIIDNIVNDIGLLQSCLYKPGGLSGVRFVTYASLMDSKAPFLFPMSC